MFTDQGLAALATPYPNVTRGTANSVQAERGTVAAHLVTPSSVLAVQEAEHAPSSMSTFGQSQPFDIRVVEVIRSRGTGSA